LCRDVRGRCTKTRIISAVGVSVRESRAEELLCSRVSRWRESRRCCVEVLEEGVLAAVALKQSQGEKRRSN
jgi:hypothetical protein